VGRYDARDPIPQGTNEERVRGIVVAVNPDKDASGNCFDSDAYDCSRSEAVLRHA